MISRVLLYLMGGLAGTMLGAGVALHLVREEGLSQPLAGAFTGCVIAAFLGLAHLLSRTVVEEEKEPIGVGEMLSPMVRPAPCAAWLIPTGGGQGRVAYPLQKPCTLIGRDVENDFMINSASISRSHAQIVRMDGSYLVLDLDSKNGTFVNGERVVQKQLHDGDELALGSVHFRIRIEDFDARREEAPAPADEPVVVPRPDWTPLPPPRRPDMSEGREEWGTASGSRRPPRKEEWGAVTREEGSWTSAARHQTWGSSSGSRYPERRRAESPMDPPFPEEQDRRRPRRPDPEPPPPWEDRRRPRSDDPRQAPWPDQDERRRPGDYPPPPPPPNW